MKVMLSDYTGITAIDEFQYWTEKYNLSEEETGNKETSDDDVEKIGRLFRESTEYL